ncbi:Hsp70 family protein [Rhodococcus sp. BP-349]|uniref:Hsp70 family protein n=1 Tax=unclassified Rhodococcus (in: high G+C Gram-positive bacteria) TaxID=192944 RepID=UPI001C9B3491|nr:MULTISPECIES: Hsp70 family protein [unclassified Rhodococcus (in: high G+C Gram-positive bacteria)]MBY6537532.1 Hsp70 family protein [Rhodococcus sp. BP-363]MBY6541869.1 Hsp70 family protein [Rhodococcus sp. BP-369]MBY6561099.1 Hsp70 family protein [Rhodococcus sp. BP-370]MBY6575391.1 Hsp70 family protein [Rhodococcus sp. BP-364]MBY6584692.1 Hsp70 family protein [Rhodococcus sp. BP-358]
MTDTEAVTSVPRDVVDSGVLSGLATVLLYDLGRGGATASIVDVDGMVVLGSVDSPVAGGDVFDRVVLDHIVDRGILERPVAGSDDTDVIVFCRRVKESLSSATVARTPGGGTTLITRDEFEAAVRPLIDRSLDTAASLVGDRHLDAVILVGGGSPIPILSVAAAERFGVPVLTALDPRATRVQVPAPAPEAAPPREEIETSSTDRTVAFAAAPDALAEPDREPDREPQASAPADAVDVGGEQVPDPKRSRVPVALVIAFSGAIMAGAAAWAFTSMPEPMDPATVSTPSQAPTSSVAPVGSRGVPSPVTTTVDPFADETEGDTGGGGFDGGGFDGGGDFGGGDFGGGGDAGGF